MPDMQEMQKLMQEMFKGIGGMDMGAAQDGADAADMMNNPFM